MKKVGRQKGCIPWNKGKKMPGRCRENSSNWKGGTYLTNDGRKMILNPDHPNTRKNGYVLRSVANMVKKIGRPLNKGEIVHHIDGDVTNDSPENLKLFPNINKHIRWHHRLLGHKKYKPSFRDPNRPVVLKKPKYFLKNNVELICEIS